MRKLLLITTLMFVGYSTVQAQETRFGAVAGYTNGFVKFDVGSVISESDSRSGFYAGLIADFEINEGFHIQPEITYLKVENQLLKYRSGI